MAGTEFAAQAGNATGRSGCGRKAGGTGTNGFVILRSLRGSHAEAYPSNRPPDPEPATEVVEVASAHAASAAAPAAATDPLAGLSPEDADTHRKAQRFARLLVDEIKLYNQAKVAEGRRNKDLYDRLKEDIDKSRGTFQKRYGNTVAASAEYFRMNWCAVWRKIPLRHGLKLPPVALTEFL